MTQLRAGISAKQLVRPKRSVVRPKDRLTHGAVLVSAADRNELDSGTREISRLVIVTGKFEIARLASTGIPSLLIAGCAVSQDVNQMTESETVAAAPRPSAHTPLYRCGTRITYEVMLHGKRKAP